MIKDNTNAFNVCCKHGMASYEDDFFDLAIVDPPYFDGPNKLGYYGSSISKVGAKRGGYDKNGTWDLPDDEYFNQLFRVSKNQIIWGCNYYADKIHSPGRIVWDKVNKGSSYSDAEIASCSIHNTVSLFSYMWNGFMQGKSALDGRTMQGNKKLNEKRIHATQKPVILYQWLLKKYAKKGFKILDTHLGSGSSRIAAHKMGYYFVGYEINKKIFLDQENRYLEYKSQLKMF